MAPPEPEWEPIARLFAALPWDVREWGEALDAARAEVLAFVETVQAAGTPVTLLAPPGDAAGSSAGISSARYGDIWLRDTGPVFAAGAAQAFRFNGWGGKYLMAGDEGVARHLAIEAGLPLHMHDFVLEGGAIDHDGTGAALTTRQCLLNPNRNPAMGEGDVEAALANSLGLARLVWLDRGLVNDHTDGHVDNLARFVAPGHVVIACPDRKDDPNVLVYADAARTVTEAGLKLTRIPSPGRVDDASGAVIPASYANFVLTNELVVVPQFGTGNDAAAVDAFAALFPERRAVGLSARAILAGGGAFHCMTNQLPKGAI
ncbi:agmatine deiminase family protein [Pacificimonas sp. WHA3]|uniref:Agmatine deiminase family protein n=1 Tax=Pacificimonas pallii TaxID=2827236 RepID=A0ABS6SEN7_9SPHN|nr:agmatine deiminase family protein [Pacificimonas pallii]MBV7256849.1 agmatine deiminase family protein [Pacificimonas pallii]